MKLYRIKSSKNNYGGHNYVAKNNEGVHCFTDLEGADKKIAEEVMSTYITLIDLAPGMAWEIEEVT